ncbi:hypothetical protein KF134_1819 [Lactococcus lactis subsp. lactis]|nr:hypothetical protein KF134_1819 [Lactococcus lactis subsp. lactis]
MPSEVLSVLQKWKLGHLNRLTSFSKKKSSVKGNIELNLKMENTFMGPPFSLKILI